MKTAMRHSKSSSRPWVKLRGYYQYYGIRGNFKMLEVVFEQTERAWQYWRSRRSHKGHITLAEVCRCGAS